MEQSNTSQCDIDMVNECIDEDEDYSIKYELDNEINALQQIDMMHDIAFISHSIASTLPSIKKGKATYEGVDHCECQSSFAIIIELFEERILKCLKINNTKCNNCLTLSIALKQHFNKEHFNHHSDGGSRTVTPTKSANKKSHNKTKMRDTVGVDKLPDNNVDFLPVENVNIEPEEHYDNMDVIIEEQNSESNLNDIRETQCDQNVRETTLNNDSVTSKPETNNQHSSMSVEQQRLSTDKNPATLFTCIFCKVKFKRLLELKTHKQIHFNPKLYECFLCGFSCVQKGIFKRHLVNKHISDIPIPCPICKEVVKHQLVLHTHMNTAHKKYYKLPPSNACPMCSEVFSDPAKYNEHFKIHQPKTIIDDEGKVMYQCNVCKKNLATRSSAFQHSKIHSGRKEHRCSVCNSEFRQRAALVLHMRIHSGIKPVVCDICGRSFSRANNLIVHKRAHLGERKHVCHCGRRFITTSSLKEHELTHSGIKNVSCDQCEKKFVSKKALKKHKNSHLGEKNHECSVCHKRFTRASNMRQHMMIHSDQPSPYYCCDVCGQSFGESKYLESHRLIHEGDMNMRIRYGEE